MSSLSIGIVGLPNVGKSTLFNALTDGDILAANYPFATIEPNTGIVPVPDNRLKKLSELYANAPIKPATVTFVDIAGLVAGASQGEGLGNQFLANIRTCRAICHVVRAFSDPNVQHVDYQTNGADGVQGTDEQQTESYLQYDEGAAQSATQQSTANASSSTSSAGRQSSMSVSLGHEPQKDIDIINTELILADLQTVQKSLPRLEKEARANPKLKQRLEALQWAQSILDQDKTLYSEADDLSIEGLELLSTELGLLTIKPVIYVFNVDEETLADEARKAELAALNPQAPAVFICAKLESELRGLDESDRQELLESYGQKESGLVQLIHAAYKTLGLQSYLTAGEKEIRAWTITKGFTAPQAAGVIHGDFERGFIAAEVVSYNDLIESGSLTAAKASGKVRTEGKTYVMQPNDIVEFRFNV